MLWHCSCEINFLFLGSIEYLAIFGTLQGVYSLFLVLVLYGLFSKIVVHIPKYFEQWEYE